ncbi:hypothetical protein ACSDR0_50700 [Streptosporangium sp. G11]
MDDDATQVGLTGPVANIIDQHKTVGSDLYTFHAVISVYRSESAAKASVPHLD